MRKLTLLTIQENTVDCAHICVYEGALCVLHSLFGGGESANKDRGSKDVSLYLVYP